LNFPTQKKGGKTSNSAHGKSFGKKQGRQRCCSRGGKKKGLNQRTGGEAVAKGFIQF